MTKKTPEDISTYIEIYQYCYLKTSLSLNLISILLYHHNISN